MEYLGGHWAGSISARAQRIGSPSLRYLSAAIVSLLVHAIIWNVFNSRSNPQELPVNLIPEVIENFILVRAPDTQKALARTEIFVTNPVPSPPIKPENKFLPANTEQSDLPLVTTPDTETPEPDKIESQPNPPFLLERDFLLESETGKSQGALGTTQTTPHVQNSKPYIPSRWALEPPLSEQNLQESWAADIDCLRSLSEDCKSLREAVFKDFMLTETQKVWTPNHADSGMSSEFYGMSEHEILKRLGVQLAGENGRVLIPGILTIDGPLWDMLHGVNKTCGIKRDVQEGGIGFTRDCPTYKPAREK